MEKIKLFEINDQTGYGNIGYNVIESWVEFKNNCLKISCCYTDWAATRDENRRYCSCSFDENNTKKLLGKIYNNEEEYKKALLEIFGVIDMSGICQTLKNYCTKNKLKMDTGENNVKANID